jgi:dipeptidase
MVVLAGAAATRACTAVIVGKKASADGSVILAHNEDLGGRQFINFRVVPRLDYPEGATTSLSVGCEISQVRQTYAFLWCQFPGASSSDTGVNEWGVAVTNNASASRVAPPSEANQKTRCDVRAWLRRLVLQRSRTAREGLTLAKMLIETYGTKSGFMTIIADPNEAWVLSIAPPKSWVAQRVPDDGVVIVPNVYIIREVDLGNTDQFVGSASLVSDAVERGWYVPASGTAFSFRDAYGSPAPGQIDGRQLRGQCLVTGQETIPTNGTQLPFAVRPKAKMSLRDVMNILRDRGICSGSTKECAILQLRSWLPPSVGCVYWQCQGRPDTGIFTPWYLGVNEVPAAYRRAVSLQQQLSLSYQLSPPAETFAPDPNLAWWEFNALEKSLLANGGESLKVARIVMDAFEERPLRDQAQADKKAMDLLRNDPKAAMDFLTDYCGQWAEKARRMAKALPTRLPSQTRPLP